jgi:hypothetical protein
MTVQIATASRRLCTRTATKLTTGTTGAAAGSSFRRTHRHGRDLH